MAHDSRRARRRVRRRRGQDPDPRLAWYAGLTLVAALELIDWPVAIVVAVGHELAHRARTRALRELAEGIQAAT